LINVPWLIQLHMKRVTFLIFFNPILMFPLITSLIIPLLNDIPPIKPFSLIVEGVSVFPLGLEVRIVYVKIAAFKIVNNLLVRQSILR
jgi:hypothetical protein